MEDYPSGAIHRNWSGTVSINVTVSAEGVVTGCTVTKSSGHAELDQAACASAYRYAHFQPALDPEGRAVPGEFNSLQLWTPIGS